MVTIPRVFFDRGIDVACDAAYVEIVELRDNSTMGRRRFMLGGWTVVGARDSPYHRWVHV